MNLTFEITGVCTIPGANRKPSEQEIEEALQRIIEYEGGKAIIYVSNLREEK